MKSNSFNPIYILRPMSWILHPTSCVLHYSVPYVYCSLHPTNFYCYCYCLLHPTIPYAFCRLHPTIPEALLSPLFYAPCAPLGPLSYTPYALLALYYTSLALRPMAYASCSLRLSPLASFTLFIYLSFNLMPSYIICPLHPMALTSYIPYILLSTPPMFSLPMSYAPYVLRYLQQPFIVHPLRPMPNLS